MEEKEIKIVNIINRNYPPESGITGESAAELTEYLELNGFKVNIFCVSGSNYQGLALKNKVSDSIIKIKTFYSGKINILRLIANLYEGYRLIKASEKKKAVITICLTDPPLLNIWASLIFKSKIKWILWSMDIYPEAFVANNLISNKNIIFKKLVEISQRHLPNAIITLGPFQSKWFKDRNKHSVPIIEIPCGIYKPKTQKSKRQHPEWHDDESLIYLGYFGNLGQAHSLDFLIHIAENLDPKKFLLIISVYGAKSPKLKQILQNKHGIRFIGLLKKEDFNLIDIHLASLNAEWTNICVPSKSVTSVCAGCSLLYYGKENSDNWALLKRAGWIISTEADLKVQVIRFLNAINLEEIIKKRKEAIKLGAELLKEKDEGFKEILKLINQIHEGVC